MLLSSVHSPRKNLSGSFHAVRPGGENRQKREKSLTRVLLCGMIALLGRWESDAFFKIQEKPKATPLGGDSGLQRIFCPNRAV